MKELEISVIENLIIIYSKYYSNGLKTSITKEAKRIYDEAHPAGTLISDVTRQAVGKLFPIAYPDVGSGINPPSKEEVKEILDKLKNLKVYLEK